jgi:hypothetical protein
VNIDFRKGRPFFRPRKTNTIKVGSDGAKKKHQAKRQLPQYNKTLTVCFAASCKAGDVSATGDIAQFNRIILVGWDTLRCAKALA